MHVNFLPTALLLLTTLTSNVLAKPTHSSTNANLDLAEIERRWSAGETEASIHQTRTYRDATPAWPIQREALPEKFAYATDERTMMRAQRQRRSENTPLLAKMKHFVNDFYRQRGDHGVIARDAQVVEADAAPVLKPRRGMRYAFTA